jgi:hypothetical protein
MVVIKYTRSSRNDQRDHRQLAVASPNGLARSHPKPLLPSQGHQNKSYWKTASIEKRNSKGNISAEIIGPWQQANRTPRPLKSEIRNQYDILSNPNLIVSQPNPLRSTSMGRKAGTHSSNESGWQTTKNNQTGRNERIDIFDHPKQQFPTKLLHCVLHSIPETMSERRNEKYGKTMSKTTKRNHTAPTSWQRRSSGLISQSLNSQSQHKQHRCILYSSTVQMNVYS